jgi:ribosome-associated protein
MSEASAKKDIQKLQRAIVDGLEDVKAHDIRVFNTEHLSPLFERVMVASGTSNRQTKALAASVRDKVREAGFAKPRIEGEDNGEWIIVDCGAAVAHIMQPVIRQYYNLEEIWGEKPVRLKGPGAAAKASRKAVPKKAPAAASAAAKPARAPAAKTAAAKTATGKKPAAKTATAKKAAPARKSATGKKPGQPQRASAGRRTSASKAPLQQLVVGKPSATSAAKPAAKSGARGAARPAAKAPARKTAARKPS